MSITEFLKSAWSVPVRTESENASDIQRALETCANEQAANSPRYQRKELPPPGPSNIIVRTPNPLPPPKDVLSQ